MKRMSFFLCAFLLGTAFLSGCTSTHGGLNPNTPFSQPTSKLTREQSKDVNNTVKNCVTGVITTALVEVTLELIQK